MPKSRRAGGLAAVSPSCPYAKSASAKGSSSKLGGRVDQGPLSWSREEGAAGAGTLESNTGTDAPRALARETEHRQVRSWLRRLPPGCLLPHDG